MPSMGSPLQVDGNAAAAAAAAAVADDDTRRLYHHHHRRGGASRREPDGPAPGTFPSGRRSYSCCRRLCCSDDAAVADTYCHGNDQEDYGCGCGCATASSSDCCCCCTCPDRADDRPPLGLGRIVGLDLGPAADCCCCCCCHRGSRPVPCATN